MNENRRKVLAKASDLLREAATLIEQVKDEEQEAYDNMPEAFNRVIRGNRWKRISLT